MTNLLCADSVFLFGLVHAGSMKNCSWVDYSPPDMNHSNDHPDNMAVNDSRGQSIKEILN